MARMEDVAFTPMDARARNHLITEAYADIADAMAELVGREHITWTALGSWTSNSVGGFLDLRIPLTNRRAPGVGRVIARPLGEGNRRVFADIGRAHAIFFETVGAAHDAGDDLEPAWDRCAVRLERAVFDPPGLTPDVGKTKVETYFETLINYSRDTHRDLLVLAFREFKDAIGTTDPGRKARKVLLGNLLIAIFEQRRLNHEISLEFRSWLRNATTRPRLFETHRDFLNRDPGPRRLALENRWIRFATRRLTTVDLPGGHRISVGKGIPEGPDPIDPFASPLPPGSDPELRELDTDELLGTLFAILTPTRDPAEDWNSLHQRLRFIFALFCHYQNAPIWFDEGGALHRPPVRTRAKNRAEARIARLTVLEEYDSGPMVRALPEEELTALADVPSSPGLEDAPSVSLETLRDDRQRRSIFRHVEADSRTRLAEMQTPDGFLTPDICRRARALYGEWELLILMGLMFRSLPADYAAGTGVRVLGEVSDLGTDSFRRAGETAHFLRDLLANDDGWNDGMLEVDGRAFASVVGVRSLHSIVAHALDDGSWDHETFGFPVNQRDVFGTALGFVVPVFEMIDTLHPGISPDDKAAYLSFWLGIGYVLGGPDPRRWFVPDEPPEIHYSRGAAAAYQLRSMVWVRTLDGVRLTEALVAGIADGFPRWAGWLAPGSMRALGEPWANKVMMIDQGRGRGRSKVVAAGLRAGLRFRATRPMTRWALQAAGRKWLEPFMRVGTARPYRRGAVEGERLEAPPGAFDPAYWPTTGYVPPGPDNRSTTEAATSP